MFTQKEFPAKPARSLIIRCCWRFCRKSNRLMQNLSKLLLKTDKITLVQQANRSRSTDHRILRRESHRPAKPKNWREQRMADSPWSGIQGLSAIDQKLYQPQKQEEPVTPEVPDTTPVLTTDVPRKSVVKPQKQQQVKKQVQVERKERQLNAWITATQNDTLDQLYFRLRAQGMRLKKGELVGIGIEILAT